MPPPPHVAAARALVRPPGPSYAQCLRTGCWRPIDVARAQIQHAAYRDALAGCGLEVVALAPADDLPDACFVEDTAIILGEHAVITRPGAPPRRPETESVASFLSRTHTCHPLPEGSLDGGDVLVSGPTVFAGLSGRTDRAGVRALHRMLAPLGREVRAVEVGAGLHLKSLVTPIGPGRLLQRAGAFPAGAFAGFDVLEVDEEHGANVLVIDRHAIVSAAAPRAEEMLAGLGLEVHRVDVSEFHAGDAGVTCLSLVC